MVGSYRRISSFSCSVPPDYCDVLALSYREVDAAQRVIIGTVIAEAHPAQLDVSAVRFCVALLRIDGVDMLHIILKIIEFEYVSVYVRQLLYCSRNRACKPGNGAACYEEISYRNCAVQHDACGEPKRAEQS